jgi:VCBS repeat-containing protein
MNGWRAYALFVLVGGLAACGGSGGGGGPPAAPAPPQQNGTPPPPANGAPTAANDNYSGRSDDSLVVAAPGVLANDSDPNGDTMTARLAAGVTNGTLTLESNGSFNYKPAAGFTGTDTFTYTASDGTRDSAVATVTIAVGDAPLLFSDTFSRATSPSVGNGWVEVETAGAAVVLDGTRLSFADASDAVMRPLVRHGFNEVTSGYLEWTFELDWNKTGTDDGYAVHMQLRQWRANERRLVYGRSRPRSGMGTHWRRGFDARLSQGRRHHGAAAADRACNDPRARRCRCFGIRRLCRRSKRWNIDSARDWRRVEHDALLHGWPERNGVLGPVV